MMKGDVEIGDVIKVRQIQMIAGDKLQTAIVVEVSQRNPMTFAARAMNCTFDGEHDLLWLSVHDKGRTWE